MAMRLSSMVTIAALALCSHEALADDEEKLAGPSRVHIDQAKEALAKGDADAAIQLLTPPPLRGHGTCILGQALHQAKIHDRAFLYLRRCLEVESAPDYKTFFLATREALRASELTLVSLSIEPSSASARVKGSYDEDILLADDDIWLPQGSHELTVTADGYEGSIFRIEVDTPEQITLPIRLQRSAGSKETTVDLGEDAGSELGAVHTTADPRPKEFKSLLKNKYKRAPDPKLEAMPEERGPGPWPWIGLGTGLASIGAGVGLHLSDREGLALAGYGVGALLTGVSSYLLLTHRDEGDAVVHASATQQGWVFGLQGRF